MQQQTIQNQQHLLQPPQPDHPQQSHPHQHHQSHHQHHQQNLSAQQQQFQNSSRNKFDNILTLSEGSKCMTYLIYANAA